MAIPEQIRKQSEAVQELYKQLNSDDAGENNAAEAKTEGDKSASGEAPPAADSGTDNALPPPTSEHGGKDGANTEDYVQKYRTLQGMYNSDVARLQNNNRDLQTRMQQMEQLLSSLQTGPAPQTAPQAFVSDSDKEEYGESIEVMRKVSREELFPLISKISTMENAIQHIAASLNTNVLPQVQRVAQQQAMSAEDRFWSELTRNVPNWQTVNDDPDFQSWLLEIDPLTGAARQAYLEQAQRSLDVGRVAAFFRAFTSMSGKYASTNAQPNRSASELERQVSPGRSRNAGTPTNQNARMYGPEDIRKFFNDVRSGKYKGRETERDRIERDIFAAQAEGRIAAT